MPRNYAKLGWPQLRTSILTLGMLQSRMHAACCLPFLFNSASNLILSAIFSLPFIQNMIVAYDSQAMTYFSNV
jgi:hypothetical protein